MIVPEVIFAIKQRMQDDIMATEAQVQQLIAKQQSITRMEDLADSIIQYEQLEGRLEDSAHVFSFFSAPVQSVLSPFVKSEVLTYVLAAARIDIEIARTCVALLREELLRLMQSDEDNVVDLVESEYREYLLPAYVLAEQYAEIDGSLREMMRMCAQRTESYTQAQATVVLRYALEVAIDYVTNLDSLIVYIRTGLGDWLSEEDRAFLLDACEERLASLRFDKQKRYNLACEKALTLIEHREKDQQI